MKIYFAGSICGGRDDQPFYSVIIEELGKYGKVLTEHVGSVSLSNNGEQGMTEQEIFERDMKWLEEADILVAEATTPSLGVGYEIARAKLWGKKVCILHRPKEGKKFSAIMLGDKDLKVFEYAEVDEIPQLISRFFEQV